MTRIKKNVHIGEVKIGTGNEELNTILGSCIGIGFLWKKRGVFGLAHCLLPESPDSKKEIGGRYVDQAIYSLTQLMNITDYRDIRVVLAGGGNMTKPSSTNEKYLVGNKNAHTAIHLLNQHNIIIEHKDLGGFEGRKMTINCVDGEYNVRCIPRNAA